MEEKIITREGEVIKVNRETYGTKFEYITVLIVNRMETYVNDNNEEIFEQKYCGIYSLQNGIDACSENETEFLSMDEFVEEVQRGILEGKYKLEKRNINFSKISDSLNRHEDFEVKEIPIKIRILKENDYS